MKTINWLKDLLNFACGIFDVLGYSAGHSLPTLSPKDIDEMQRATTSLIPKYSGIENARKYLLFENNLKPVENPKPLRKDTCKGCGAIDYKVIDGFDECNYCGREYERETVTYRTQDNKVYDIQGKMNNSLYEQIKKQHSGNQF